MEQELLIDKYLHSELSEQEWTDLNHLLENDSEFAQEFEYRLILFADKSSDIKLKIAELNGDSIYHQLQKFLEKTTSNNLSLLAEKAKKIQDLCEVFILKRHQPPTVLRNTNSHFAHNKNYALGITAYQNEHFPIAKMQLSQCIENEETNEEALFYLALSCLYSKTPNWAEAIYYFEQIKQEKKIYKTEELNWYLALCYLNIGQLQKSFDLLQDIQNKKAWNHQKALQLLNLIQGLD